MTLVQLGKSSPHFAAECRFRPIGDKVLVTSLEGNFVVLSQDEFREFSNGTVSPESALHQRLSTANLVRSAFDTKRAAAMTNERKSFLRSGPNLHVFVVTLRCNETCVYCHASRADMTATDTDMTPAIAERCVDLALSTTSPFVTIEFQGGEPLANFGVVQHIIDYANQRNAKLGKTLEFTLVTNLGLMTEERMTYLLDHKVQICTSIDGPQALHDKQRKLAGGSAHATAAGWIKRINEAYVERGLDPTLYHIEALLTTTRDTLSMPREVVDSYTSLGCRALFLRPVDPFGFASRAESRIEYPRDEYLAFYRSAVDYMLTLNRDGTEVLERFAAIFLTKILKGTDPNYLDIRSPCGAGIGQVAYNYDGKIFTCDEGRMLHEMKDDTFLIGDAATSKYRELMGHPTVRALAIASNLDSQPDCVNCTYQPYCGVCPVHSYRTQGTVFGRMRESVLCAVHKGIQDYLFEKLAENDPETMSTFGKWTTVRERSHYLQSC
jgi:His-Xaa-Ser system radical SAM maturase HxsB